MQLARLKSEGLVNLHRTLNCRRDLDLGNTVFVICIEADRCTLRALELNFQYSEMHLEFPNAHTEQGLQKMPKQYPVATLQSPPTSLTGSNSSCRARFQQPKRRQKTDI